MRRGQQPDSRLMMSIRRGSWWRCHPTDRAIGSIQLQSPCLNVVGIVVVVVVGWIRYGVASMYGGASTLCALAFSANAVIRDKITMILMIVRISVFRFGQEQVCSTATCACFSLQVTRLVGYPSFITIFNRRVIENTSTITGMLMSGADAPWL